jgi:Protein of unknown function (DUF2846)
MKTSLFLTLGLILVSCGSPNPNLAPPSADAVAKRPWPTTRFARIYIFRPKTFYGHALKVPTVCDTQLVGQLTVGTFMLLEVPPGSYTLTSTNLNSDEVTVRLGEGETAFFHQHMGFQPAVKYDRVSTSEGLAAIQSLKRVNSRFKP